MEASSWADTTLAYRATTFNLVRFLPDGSVDPNFRYGQLAK